MSRMKKRVIVLAVIFCVFLVLGCIHNLQEGVYIGSDFWVKQSDGRYTCYDDSIRVEKAEDGVQFALTTDGRNWTAELMKRETGWLLTTDQGWSVRVETTGLPSIGVEVNGRYISLGEGKTLLIDDDTLVGTLADLSCLIECGNGKGDGIAFNGGNFRFCTDFQTHRCSGNMLDV